MPPRKKKSAALTVLPPEESAALAEQRETYAAALKWIQDSTITTQEEADVWVAQIRQLKETRKALEEKRDAMLGPARATVDSIKAEFTVIDFIVQCEKAAQGKLDARMLEQSQARKLALAQVEAAGGQVSAATLAVAVGAENIIAPEGTRKNTYWYAEVTDGAALIDGLVLAYVQARGGLEKLTGPALPVEMLALVQINEKALGMLAREHKDALVLPGVRVWSQERTTVLA